MRTVAQLLLTFVLNAAWQVTLITALAAFAAWLLRGTACRYRHAVWVAALVLSILLPAISAFRLIGVEAQAPRDESVAVSYSTTPSTPISKGSSVAIDTPQTFSRPEAIPLTSRLPLQLSYRMALSLLVLYALLVGYNGLKLFRAWLKTRSIVRSARPVKLFARKEALLARCQKAANIRRARILCSEEVPVPITAGVLKPLVILPGHLVMEEDDDVFSTAVGHELFHVARHDYFLNFLFELIYLPISFNPAASLLRRRIKETREICCDELVAGRLMDAGIYARSLVRLIDSAPMPRQLPANTTIGISEANILEVRIMSLLQSSKSNRRPRALLSTAVVMLLLTPCLAAASFALDLDLDRDFGSSSLQDGKQKRLDDLAKAREELKRKQRELEKVVRQNREPSSKQLEQVRRLEQDLEKTAEKIRKHEMDSQQNEAKQRLREVQQTLEQYERERPEREARMREMRSRLAQLVTQYPDKALSGSQQEELRNLQNRLQEGAKERERAMRDLERMKERSAGEEAEHAAEREREARERSEQSREQSVENERLREGREAERVDERVDMSRAQKELADAATVSMDRAIQIATGSFPGKVVSCQLQRQRNGQPSYRVVIIVNDSGKSVVRHVWVSAQDGQIVKTEQE